MFVTEMSLVQRHHHRLQGLRTERSSFDGHWMDIAKNLLPRRSRFMHTEVNRGSKQNQAIIDSTATFALNILVAGLFTGVTSPARKWFRLTTPDPDLREFGPVKDYLNRVERIMYDVFNASNFYRVVPSLYEELGAFGTGVMVDLPDFDTLSRYGAFTVGEYWLAQDHNWKVDAAYREVQMTVKQVVDKYGDRTAGPNRRWNNFSNRVKDKYQRGDYDQWVTTVHCISDNYDFVPGSTRKEELPFQQVVYELAEEGGTTTKQPAQQTPLHVGGFTRNPIYGVRWHLMPPDVYGRSPGMDALGDIRQLQDQQKKKGSALAKHVNPPMTAPTSMRDERKSTLPGDVTYIDAAQGQQGFAPAYQTQPRLSEFVADMEDVRARIRRAFHSDLFLIITERPGVQPLNDSEIFERKEEKLLALGPVMERLDDDLLGPVIGTTRERIEALGLAGPRPEELMNVPIRAEYLNVIAQAQRSQGLLGLQDTLGFVGQVAAAQAASGVEVTAWDKVDTDQAIDEYADMRGNPAGVIRSDDDTAEVREQRRAAAARQQALAAASQAASAAKDLGDVETESGNLVTDLQNAAAGQGPGLQVVR